MGYSAVFDNALVNVKTLSLYQQMTNTIHRRAALFLVREPSARPTREMPDNSGHRWPTPLSMLCRTALGRDLIRLERPDYRLGTFFSCMAETCNHAFSRLTAPHLEYPACCIETSPAWFGPHCQ
jgi:hypothetical protein